MAAIYAISLDAVSQVKKNGKNYSTEGLDLQSQTIQLPKEMVSWGSHAPSFSWHKT